MSKEQLKQYLVDNHTLTDEQAVMAKHMNCYVGIEYGTITTTAQIDKEFE